MKAGTHQHPLGRLAGSAARKSKRTWGVMQCHVRILAIALMATILVVGCKVDDPAPTIIPDLSPPPPSLESRSPMPVSPSPLDPPALPQCVKIKFVAGDRTYYVGFGDKVGKNVNKQELTYLLKHQEQIPAKLRRFLLITDSGWNTFWLGGWSRGYQGNETWLWPVHCRLRHR